MLAARFHLEKLMHPPDPKTDADSSVVPTDPERTPDVPEQGGGKGPEPTRYGDWEVGGICTDF
jgi:hypothetical protein